MFILFTAQQKKNQREIEWGWTWKQLPSHESALKNAILDVFNLDSCSARDFTRNSKWLDFFGYSQFHFIVHIHIIDSDCAALIYQMTYFSIFILVFC